MVSRIVTVDDAVLKLPLASVAVKLTVFAPILVQLKLVFDKLKVAILQLSFEPLFI